MSDAAHKKQSAFPGRVCKHILSSVAKKSTTPHWPCYVALLATFLTLPSLTAGWLPDDYHHQIRLIGDGPLSKLVDSQWDLFRFAGVDADQNQELMDIGVWPWWTVPELRAAFWRPISVVTHWLDYQLWPGSAAAMHAQSILWYGLLAYLVALLYRRICGPVWIAGLAALLYAIDDARAMPVGFIANRNALIATSFGVLAILSHDRWRREQWMPGVIVAPLLLAASLFSAEAGIGTIAYLFAHTVFLDPSESRKRFAVLLPYAFVVVAWRIIWSSKGYGIYGMGSYVDPLNTPLDFLIAMAQRIPVLLLGQFLLPPSQLHLLFQDHGFGLHYSIVAFVIIFILAMTLVRKLKWDVQTRFWTTGMLLALIPICATFAADRMLFFVGLGGFALIAQYLSHATGVSAEQNNTESSKTTKGSVALTAIHLGLAPVGLLIGSFFPVGAHSSLLDKYEGAHISLDDTCDQQTVVLVSAPLPLAAGYLPERRELANLPVPRHTRTLAPAFPRPVVVTRLDEFTLQIAPSTGFLNNSLDRLARGADFPMSAGETVRLTGMSAEVVQVLEDGRPSAVNFRFDTPLEDDTLKFFYWEGGFFSGEFAGFVLPPVGDSVRLE